MKYTPVVESVEDRLLAVHQQQSLFELPLEEEEEPERVGQLDEVPEGVGHLGRDKEEEEYLGLAAAAPLLPAEGEEVADLIMRSQRYSVNLITAASTHWPWLRRPRAQRQSPLQRDAAASYFLLRRDQIGTAGEDDDESDDGDDRFRGGDRDGQFHGDDQFHGDGGECHGDDGQPGGDDGGLSSRVRLCEAFLFPRKKNEHLASSASAQYVNLPRPWVVITIVSHIRIGFPGLFATHIGERMRLNPTSSVAATCPNMFFSKLDLAKYLH